MGSFPFRRALCASMPEQYLSWLTSRAPELEVSRFECPSGDPLDGLLRAALDSKADLLLTGLAPGRSGRSLARRLAMQAPCSVWTVPPESRAGVSRILAPVDFSGCSRDALATAAVVARAHGLDEVHALHVYFDDSVATYEEHEDFLKDREVKAFGDFLRPLAPLAVAVREIWEDNPRVAATILRVAGELGCDLIVMGTRGRSGSAAVLLGSETDRVLEESAIPVLAVKHFGARLGFLEALLDRQFRRRNEGRFG